MQAANVNKTNFWKTIGPFFSNKSVKQAKKLILIEQNDIVSDDSKVAEIFSKHFSEITKSLNIPEYAPKDKNFTKIEDSVLRAIEKYKDHPSIVRISSFSGTNQKRFQFKHFYPWEVRTKILTARNKKSDLQVPMMILKQCTDSCVIPLTDLINNIVNDQNWPVELGSANITPAHKKMSTTDKRNYRPISVLPSISKIFEKLLYEQLPDFMKDKLSPFLCGSRKQHSTQHALIRIVEKWKKCIDDSGTIVAVLMDLSKAYDCIPHDLLIAKLHAYGVRIKSLKLLFSYLTNRTQRVKVNESFSEWVKIIIGVPQGSVSGPLLNY